MRVADGARRCYTPPIMGAAEPRLSIVTPLFNEAANVPERLAQVRSALAPTGWSYEVLCVDDARSDGTAAAVRSAAAGDGRIRLIRKRIGRAQAVHLLSAGHALEERRQQHLAEPLIAESGVVDVIL